MAKQVIKGYRIYINGRDASGDFNRVNLVNEAGELDSTDIGNLDKSFQAGLRNLQFDGEVFASHGSGEVEEAVMALLAAGGKVISVYASDSAGGAGHAFQAEMTIVSPVMAIGDMSRITVKASQSGGMLVKVTSMEGKAVKTSSGTGTVRQLVAVGAGLSLHSFLQVLAVSGTSPQLTVTIKSDDAVGFSTPTTQITHSMFNAARAEVKTKAGPVTDTYYRVDWTITGTDPSFTFDVGLGVR